LQLDLALVTLDAPVGGIVPLPLADVDDDTSQTFTLGYAVTDPSGVRIQGCVRTLEEGAVIGLDCPAVEGFSGGAVVTKSDVGWRLAAVIVARGKGNGLTGTYAVTVPGELAER
jgi:hypothetical protein